jgi:hypothetical protein
LLEEGIIRRSRSFQIQLARDPICTAESATATGIRFLKRAAGVLGGTAVTLLKAKSEPSEGTSAGMFDGFKISKVQTTGATINVILGGQDPPVEMSRRSNMKEGLHVGLDFYDLLIEALMGHGSGSALRTLQSSMRN